MLRTRRAAPLAGTLLASSLFIAGCLDPDTTDPDSEPTGAGATDKAYVLADNVWRSNVLTVCWEQSGLDAEKFWVRDAIRRTWEAESTVQFIGWQKCDGSKWSLRVELADEGGRTKGLGNDLFDESSGVRLNTWATSNGNCAAGWDRERCVRSTAVHEFGHALGFAHEQNRGDTPSTCDKAQGTDGTEVVGEWDVMSVMNYCNPVRNGDARLSGTDIAALQRYYGAPQLTSTVSMAPGRIDMFGRTRDDAIWQRTFENGQWGPQVYLGGQASSPPVAVSWGPGRIDLFARGVDGWLYHRASDQSWGGTWTPWTSLERTIQGTPAVVSWGPDRLDIFARSSDGSMLHRAWAGTYWSNWVDLGLPFIGTPSAVSWGPGRVDVFARGLDSQLYHLAWDGAVSSGWVAHGGVLTSILPPPPGDRTGSTSSRGGQTRLCTG